VESIVAGSNRISWFGSTAPLRRTVATERCSVPDSASGE
jgi:hypothetical protein